MPDSSRLERAVGFKAVVPLEDGLRSTLDHWGLRAEAPGPVSTRPFLSFVRPSLTLGPRLLSKYTGALRSPQLTNNGPRVREFENKVADWLGAGQAVAVSSGSTALLVALKALGVSGQAILPSYTYIATINAVVNLGLEPLFCDIDPARFTMCPRALAELLESNPSATAILPVNCFGVPPDLETIGELARRHGAAILYDNAHGFGTEDDSRRLSAEPTAQCFSLHATKILPAIEGGLVLSGDDRFLDEVRRIRNHGLAEDPFQSSAGYNAKMDELRATIALETLSEMDGVLSRRRAYAGRMCRALLGAGGFRLQQCPGGIRTNHQNLPVLCEVEAGGSLPSVAARFRHHGVEARRYFHPPLHRMATWQGGADLPNTDAVWERLLCLPIYSRMSERELARIEGAIAQTSPSRVARSS